MSESDAKPDAKAAVLRARQLLKDKRYADALQVCTDELARGAADPELRLIAAHGLFAQGRHDGAQKEAQLVVRLDPRRAEAYRILSEIACTRGEFGAAREHLEHVLELDPADQKSRALLETLSRPGTPMPNLPRVGTRSRLAPGSSPRDTGNLKRAGSGSPAPAKPSAAAEATPLSHAGDATDPFPEESLQITDSMMVEMPSPPGPAEDATRVERPRQFPLDATEQRADGGEGRSAEPVPVVIVESKAAPPPPGLRTERDAHAEAEGKKRTPASGRARGSAIAEDWRPEQAKVGAASPGVTRAYPAPMRVASLRDLPGEEEGPTVPLLRATVPPAPQPHLDPRAATTGLAEQRGGRPRPESPGQVLASSARSEEAVPRSALGLGRVAVSGTIGESSPSSSKEALGGAGGGAGGGAAGGAAGGASGGAAGGAEQVMPPSHRGSGSEAGPPAAEGTPLDPFELLEEMPSEGTPAEAASAPDNVAPVRSSPKASRSVRGPGDLIDLLTSDETSGAELPARVEGTGEFLLEADSGVHEPAEFDLAHQLLEADIAHPAVPRGSGSTKRWILLMLVGMLGAGGGGAGYFWYRSYKFVQAEWQKFRSAVYTSTPEGYSVARHAAEQILGVRARDPRAQAATAMCDAAKSVEFGEDKLKAARELLAQSRGTDSEWRTAANAFLALMDDPDRAAGYLQHGLEVYPDSAILYYLRGRALAATETPERAGESYQSALRLAPRYVAAQLGLAELVGQQDAGYSEALQALEHVLSVDPRNVQALLQRALLRTRHNKELEAAAEDARRVVGELASHAGRGQLGWGHLLLARVARLQQQYPAMSGAIDEAMKSPPCCDSAFRYELAGELIALYRLPEAHGQLRAALELKPKQPEYLQRMARVLLELDDPRAAQDFVQRAPARHLETRVLAGRLAYAQRRYGQAADLLQRLLVEKEAQAQGEAAIYLALAQAQRKHTAEATRALEQLAEQRRTDHRVPLALAQVELWGGNYEKAHTALKAVWKLTKLDPAAPTLAGELFFAQHDVATARARFERALQIRADYRPARLGHARLLIHVGELAAARKDLEQIAPVDQAKADVFATRARLELATGNLSAARAAIDDAARADLPKSLLSRLSAELAVAQKQGPAAVQLVQEALKLGHPRSADLLALLGQAHKAAGKLDDAYDAFEQALKLDGRQPEVLIELGRLAVSDGEVDLAVRRLNDALTQIKEQQRPAAMKATAYTVLGLAYLRKKDTGRALTNLQDAIDLDHAAAEPNFVMGEVYDRLERPARAVPYYAKALELDPSSIEAYERLGRDSALGGNREQALRYYQEYLNHKPPAAKAQAVEREIQRLQAH